MSSSKLQTCAFCTYINVPESKICLICENLLPVPAQPKQPKVKVCPGCSLFNETFYDTCKICGTELKNDSKSRIGLHHRAGGFTLGMLASIGTMDSTPKIVPHHRASGCTLRMLASVGTMDSTPRKQQHRGASGYTLGMLASVGGMGSTSRTELTKK